VFTSRSRDLFKLDLYKCDPSNICAAVNKISTDRDRRAGLSAIAGPLAREDYRVIDLKGTIIISRYGYDYGSLASKSAEGYTVYDWLVTDGRTQDK